MRRALVVFALAVAVSAQGSNFGKATDIVREGIRKLRTNDFKGAAADFTKAIELEPNIAAIRAFRGVARGRMGQRKEALADFDKAVELDPKDWNALSARAQARGGLGMYAEAEADYDKLLQQRPKDPRLLSARGSMRTAQNNYDTGLADYDAAIAINPKDIMAVYRRGRLRLAIGKHDGAIADLGSVIELNPDAQPAYFYRAISLRRKGLLERALDDLATAMILGPNDPRPYVLRARILRAGGKLDEANADIEKALASSGRSGDALFGAGAFAYEGGDAKKAVKLLEEALTAKVPTRSFVQLYLALARTKAGERDKAVAEMEKHLASLPAQDNWYAKAGAYLIGKIDTDAFMAAAKADNKYLNAERVCRTSWFVGAKLWNENAFDIAKRHLQSAQGGVATFDESESARAVLARWDEITKK